MERVSKGVRELAFGIRERILVAFVVLLLIPMSVLGGISYFGIKKVGTTTTSGSVSALEEQQRVHLLNLSTDQADATDQFLSGIKSDTAALQAYATDLFTRRGEYGNGYPTYNYTGKTLSPALPSYGYINQSSGEGKGAWADWDHMLLGSPYLNSSVVKRAEADPAYAAWAGFELNTTMQLDLALKPAYDKNQPNVVLTWFSRAGGISTCYSVPPLDWGELLASGAKKADWNESFETYYQIATPARDPTRAVVWVPPYYDTVGNGWLVSCVAPVYRQDEFVGVIGMDLTLDAVEEAVLGIKVMQSGHAFLIDRDGNAVAHKDLERAIQKEMDSGGDLVVPITALETDARAFRDVVARMRNGEQGIFKAKYSDGRDRYLAFAPIRSAGFSIGVVIPVDEVVKPIRDVETRMSSSNEATKNLMLFIDAVAIVMVIGVGVVLANRIVRPIKELTDAARSVSEGNLNVNLAAGYKDELQTLARSFQNILVTLRLGNIAYYEGDSNKALENYTSALSLFEATENLKGTAMCLNNLGNIYRGWKEYGKALEHYARALKIDQKRGDRAGMANRMSNIGITYKSMGQIDKAMEQYTAALAVDRETGDKAGIATRLNNIGIIYQSQGNDAKAMELFQEALALDEETGNVRGMNSRLNNVAVIYTRQGRLKEALDCSLRSLKISIDLEDKRGLANDFVNLHKIYEAMGQKDKAAEFLAKYRAIRAKIETSRKTVIFVLDRSDSMSGAKMQAAQEGAVNLFRSKVYDDDNVAVIAFSSESQLLMKLSKKKGNENRFEETVWGITTRGMTSFYDAVGDALDHFRLMGKDSSLWVVALTDGDDNTSYKFGLGVVKQSGVKDLTTYVDQIGVNATIIIIGVGEEIDENAMTRIAGSKGRYIHVTEQGSADIGTAIKEAYKEVEMLFEEEEKVEGFVPEA
jgi:tetratricopeptide (TPR) repeat protein